MLPATDESNSQAMPNGQPEKLPPCQSCQTTSPKTHELRTRYEARHAAEAALKSPLPESKP